MVLEYLKANNMNKVAEMMDKEINSKNYNIILQINMLAKSIKLLPKALISLGY